MGEISLSKKKFHNYLSGILVKGAILLSQLFLIPIYISGLGVGKYGEWLIITTIPGYLLLSDLGLTQTVTNEMCRLINLKKYEEQERLFKSTVSFLFLLGVILMVLFAGVFLVFNIRDVFNLTYITEHECFWILGFYVLNVVLSLIFRLVIGYFKALNEFYKHEYVLFATYMLDFVCTLLVLTLKLPLFYIPLSFSVIRFIIFFIINRHLSSIPFYKIGLTRELKYAKDMLPVSIKLSFFTLGYALLLQGNTMMVGTMLGGTAVVIFNTVRTLINSIKAFVSVFYLPTMPEFSILMSENRYAEAGRKMASLLVRIFLMSLGICLFIYFFRDFIMQLWLKNSITYSNVFIIFMLLSILFQNLWNAASMLPLAINNLSKLSLFPVLCAIALVVQYFIITSTRLEGVAVSLFVMDVLMLLFVMNINKKLIQS